jgi:hypothetical protein
MGFHSQSRHQKTGSTHTESSHASRYGPPSGFLTLSTVSAPISLAALFHAATTSGIRPSGVFPPEQPYPPYDEPFPLAVVRVSPTDPKTGANSTRPDFRAFATRESVALQHECYPAPAPDPLLSFTSLGFSLPSRWQRFPVTSSHELRPGPSQ